MSEDVKQFLKLLGMIAIVLGFFIFHSYTNTP